MVSPCKCLEVDEEKLVREYVQDRVGRNAEIFSRFEGAWIRAVRRYVEHQGNPEEIRPINVYLSLARKLRRLYSHPTGRAKSVKADLRKHGLFHCPFCGEMGKPNTLDHYLPKEVFPEFAITPTNLVPMCDKCQTEKGNDYLDDDGNKAFLHPYFDCGDIVIYVEMNGGFEPPRSLDIVFEANADVEDICQRHIAGLNMKSRFGEYFSKEHVNLKMNIEKRFSDKGEDAEEHIRRYLEIVKELHEAKSVNHWDTITFRSLLRSEDWIEFMGEKCRAYEG